MVTSQVWRPVLDASSISRIQVVIYEMRKTGETSHMKCDFQHSIHHELSFQHAAHTVADGLLLGLWLLLSVKDELSHDGNLCLYQYIIWIYLRKFGYLHLFKMSHFICNPYTASESFFENTLKMWKIVFMWFIVNKIIQNIRMNIPFNLLAEWSTLVWNYPFKSITFYQWLAAYSSSTPKINDQIMDCGL